MVRRHLILGSEGVIGKALCKHLQYNGQNVLEFDIENSLDQDLRTADNLLLDCFVQQCDFVYFLAYDVGGSKYLELNQSSIAYNANNLQILANTFRVLDKYQKPFIFASSQMSNMLASTYGLSKLLGERLTESLNGVSVKFWNVYGPEESGEKSHVIADFIHSAKQNNLIQMRTVGKEQRQFLHTDDCARALYTLSKVYNQLDRDKPYHITSFKWTSILDLARLVADAVGDTEIVPGSNQDQVQEGKMNQPDPYILNYWQPTIDLACGIGKLL